MNPLVSLRRRPHRTSSPEAGNPWRAGASRDAGDGKPSLDVRGYMEVLNQRLRQHPMYMEGMYFPDPQPGSTPMLAAALAWEGAWDCLGVFSSVIDDVARDYDLASDARAALGPRYAGQQSAVNGMRP